MAFRKVVACPVCNSQVAVYLGQLGNLRWLRCRDCGQDYHQPQAAALVEEIMLQQETKSPALKAKQARLLAILARRTS
jgi:transcription elongation factor Elf1